jgi:hypothetical protein
MQFCLLSIYHAGVDRLDSPRPGFSILDPEIDFSSLKPTTLPLHWTFLLILLCFQLHFLLLFLPSRHPNDLLPSLLDSNSFLLFLPSPLLDANEPLLSSSVLRGGASVGDHAGVHGELLCLARPGQGECAAFGALGELWVGVSSAFVLRAVKVGFGEGPWSQD